MEGALCSANLSLGDIELLAVTNGPGTFTGVRTGLATIKAFAATLNLSVVPIPTLHAIAIAEGEPHENIVVMLPAGRKEVFAQMVALGEAYELIELNAPSHIAPEVLINQIEVFTRNILFVGAGARLYVEQLQQRALQLGISFAAPDGLASNNGEGWRAAPSSKMPLAIAVAKIAVKYLACKAEVSAQDVRALYVRPSDAELKNKC